MFHVFERVKLIVALGLSAWSFWTLWEIGYVYEYVSTELSDLVYVLAYRINARERR